MIGRLEPLIHVITGPMYSSKTKELLSQVDRYQYADCKYQIFKPKKDNRYSETSVVTHKGEELPCEVVEDSSELVSKLRIDTNVVGIDEIMLFDSEVVNLCSKLRSEGNIVIASCLDMLHDLRPFPFSDGIYHVGDLFAIADIITNALPSAKNA